VESNVATPFAIPFSEAGIRAVESTALIVMSEELSATPFILIPFATYLLLFYWSNLFLKYVRPV